MRINYGIADRADLEREPPGSGLLWRGTGQLLGDRIEWRLARGRPFAAIVRIFTLGPDERALQQFLVAKVTPAGSCELSRIDVKEPNAFATARDIAELPLRHRRLRAEGSAMIPVRAVPAGQAS